MANAAAVLALSVVVGLAVGPQRNLERGAVAVAEAVGKAAKADPDGAAVGHAGKGKDKVLLRLALNLGQAKTVAKANAAGLGVVVGRALLNEEVQRLAKRHKVVVQGLLAACGKERGSGG